MTVNNRKQAWEAADKIFPADYNKDESKSQNAGYDIYISTIENAWIGDLGNRLEVNLANGETINIWIEEPKMTKAEVIKNIMESTTNLLLQATTNEQKVHILEAQNIQIQSVLNNDKLQ